MKLELVTFALCPFVHRTFIALHEKSVPYETKYIDLAHKPEWFSAISPRGKVPVLVLDGEPVFESAIINELVDELFPPRLLPEAPIERARERAWVEVGSDLNMAQHKLVHASGDAYEAANEAVRAILGRVEAHLAGEFFAGARFGLADAAFAPALYRFLLLERATKTPMLDAFPKVRAWAERLAARPSVTAGLVPDFTEQFVASVRAANGAIGSRLR